MKVYLQKSKQRKVRSRKIVTVSAASRPTPVKSCQRGIHRLARWLMCTQPAWLVVDWGNAYSTTRMPHWNSRAHRAVLTGRPAVRLKPQQAVGLPRASKPDAGVNHTRCKIRTGPLGTHPQHDLTPFSRLREVAFRGLHGRPRSQQSESLGTHRGKESYAAVQQSSSETVIRISRPAASQDLPLQGEAEHRRRDQIHQPSILIVENHTPTQYQLLWPRPNHPNGEESRTGLIALTPCLSMTPQADANTPPPTGSPDPFSRPRPRPPRSASQAAKIRVQNRRRQYLENNPGYLSSADNQLAGKPQLTPAHPHFALLPPCTPSSSMREANCKSPVLSREASPPGQTVRLAPSPVDTRNPPGVLPPQPLSPRNARTLRFPGKRG